MTPFDSVIVPTDFSEAADRALALGLNLARRGGGHLHIVHVIEPYETGPLSPLRYAPDAAALGATPEEAIGEFLASAMLRHDLDGVSVEPVVLKRGPTPEALLRYAASVEAAGPLVVGRNRRAGLLRRRRVGSTTEALVRRTDRPVVVVPAAMDEAQAAPAVQHVLLAEDFSPPAEQAVAHTRAWAAALDASLTLLFVAEHRAVPVFTDAGLFSFVELEPDPEVVARAPEGLEQLFESAGGPNVPARFLVRESGDVAREIVAAAEAEGADLVVLAAARGKTDNDRRIGMGSVTEKVLRRADVPVAVLPFEPADGTPADEPA